jgi:mutator protein MutT
MNKPIEVAAGLIFRDGRLLITQRPKSGHLPGRWEFPGGKREPDETLPECLQRELREELDIEVNVGEPAETITHSYPEKVVKLIFFHCQLAGGEPRGREGQSIAWVNPDEFAGYEFPEADARLLEKLQRETAWWK